MLFKIIDQFCRFFVGILFIFSGLIKLNDPVGTEIKMEEYFEVFAQDFGSFFLSLKPVAMELGFLMIVLEIVLGVAVLILYRMRITTVVLLALILFFTFLTFYSAFFNKVTDCGCFGDAIKLTPWQSFGKDIILLILIAHLFWYRKKYVPVLRAREGFAVVAITTVLCFVLGIYAIRHLPFIDFRAYKIGNHIPTQMLPAEQPVFEYIFLDKNTQKEVVSDKYLMDADTYQYVSIRQVNADKTKPKITDYSISSVDGDDVTQFTFEGSKVILVIYDVTKASTKHIAKIRSLINDLEGKVEVIALTSSSPVQFESFRHEHQLAVPYYFGDATVLKTMIRANPGILVWKDGVVKNMWHYNDTPTAEKVLESLK
jgi:uncharacterized membrane protein YphA (DoxX/SURF4 family)/peroxiredoxin